MIANKMRLFKLALPLLLGIALCSVCGIFISDFYSAESPSWKVQALAQDYMDLFVLLPVLAVSFLLMYKGVRAAVFVWVGALLYSAYTFLIYSFSTHFNPLFPVYCWVLGLSVFSLIMFVAALDPGAVSRWRISSGGKAGAVAASIIILVSIAFYGLWMAEIVPAIVKGVVPASVKEVGGLVNPVHVIDLSLFLPGMLLAAVLYFKQNPWGTLFAPAMMPFMVLMNISIAVIAAFQFREGFASGLTLVWVFGGLALFCTLLFSAWMRTGMHK